MDTAHELIRIRMTPISVRILIAWEKAKEALALPDDVVLHARWITY